MRIAYLLAQESGRIRTDVMESIEFPHLDNKYHVRGVPTVVIDESTSFVGGSIGSLLYGENSQNHEIRQ